MSNQIPKSNASSCLHEAVSIVEGSRAAEYGDQRTNFAKYGRIATEMLDSAELEELKRGQIPASVVAKILMSVKIGRHAFRPKRDNIVDLLGYGSILHEIQE